MSGSGATAFDWTPGWVCLLAGNLHFFSKGQVSSKSILLLSRQDKMKKNCRLGLFVWLLAVCTFSAAQLETLSLNCSTDPDQLSGDLKVKWDETWLYLSLFFKVIKCSWTQSNHHLLPEKPVGCYVSFYPVGGSRVYWKPVMEFREGGFVSALSDETESFSAQTAAERCFLSWHFAFYW